ncbi:DUF1850 domain-containing protein [Rossellomorea vietnamensis]|uniref:DUF1850 domain-containing protein n=1 Tax=Rossellomorea vietnamensis TaxID=218284 RepID=A0A5D4MBD2_9BACI|nr:DUF1850 domain-containing protein [Rossellomorea vietnamensis]TYR98623.1 DUF1850 domain-containing protein [Rossellomorea vietnamensis]
MKWKRAAAAAAVCTLLLLVLVPFKTCIVMESLKKESKEVLVPFPVDNQAEFSILYTHSIHLSDVLETYKVDKKSNIVQTTLVYEDTAIGMPGGATGKEVFERTEDGKYKISNLNRIFPHIDISIGQVAANHRFIYNEKVYRLADYFEKGTLIRMSVKKQSLFQLWKGVILNG